MSTTNPVRNEPDLRIGSMGSPANRFVRSAEADVRKESADGAEWRVVQPGNRPLRGEQAMRVPSVGFRCLARLEPWSNRQYSHRTQVVWQPHGPSSFSILKPVHRKSVKSGATGIAGIRRTTRTNFPARVYETTKITGRDRLHCRSRFVSISVVSPSDSIERSESGRLLKLRTFGYVRATLALSRHERDRKSRLT